MAIRQSSAYALTRRPLGEADLIVELFTLELGRVRVVARSARRLRSRFGSALEPLTRSRAVWFQRDKDDLGRLSSCEIERSWFELLADEERAVAAAYIAELIVGLVPERDPLPALFRLLGALLDALDRGLDLDLALRYFELWILRLSGLYPDLRACGRCGRALSGAAWVCERSLEFLCGAGCGGAVGRRRLSASARSLACRMVRAAPEELPAGGGEQARAARNLEAVHDTLLRGHLARPPRSAAFLRRLRASRRRAI